MQYVRVPPAGALDGAAPRHPALFLPLTCWASVVALTFIAYCTVVAHEAGRQSEARYRESGMHRSTLFTSPPNGRSILSAIIAAVDGHEGGVDG